MHLFNDNHQKYALHAPSAETSSKLLWWDGCCCAMGAMLALISMWTTLRPNTDSTEKYKGILSVRFLSRGAMTGRHPASSYRWYADVSLWASRSLHLWLWLKKEKLQNSDIVHSCCRRRHMVIHKGDLVVTLQPNLICEYNVSLNLFLALYSCP